MAKLDFNKPVQTRDGKPVRIICTDALGPYPIVGLIKFELDGEETPHHWTLDGRLGRVGRRDPWDLIQAPEQIRGWVNVYRMSDGHTWIGGLKATRTEADNHRSVDGLGRSVRRIACIEINVPEGHGLEGDEE